MCGIAGYVRRTADEGDQPPHGDRRAIDAIRHRGPDAQGEYADGPLWFGHARLSIIDLSDCARQPMTAGDGRFAICYNGEVYNFRELASELALDNLRSHSDTEVVLRAFARLGVDAFTKLNGMFAFAVYDRQRQTLWLVRDRLGIKPLYYTVDSEGLSFGSEIKAVRALSGRAPVCDLASLHEWLYYGNALGGRTLYQGIRQLLPGHYLELDLRSFEHRTVAYWSLEQMADPTHLLDGSTGGLIARTRELLDRAVQRQLVSDVPVGVFLSGGVDSSAITAFAAKHHGPGLTTYAAGFDALEAEDERPKARRIARRFGTSHHELYVTGADVAGVVEKMVHHHDMPFADAANLPLYMMAAQISGTTKVVLQGDGGDELFGGYRRHVSMSHYAWMHRAARLAEPLQRALPESLAPYRVQRYVRAFAAPDIGSTMALLMTLEDETTRPASVFAPGIQQVVERSDPFARYRQCQAAFAGHDPGNQMLLVDLLIELPDVFLEKVDRATMAASLEVRVPFLDHDLVDFVVRIPGAKKIPGGKKKWLLKQALAGIVPDEVLYGPKVGFNVPFGTWLRTSLKPFFFDHLATFERQRPGVLNTAVIQHTYAASDGRVDCSSRLWKLLNFMIWCNTAGVEIPA